MDNYTALGYYSSEISNSIHNIGIKIDFEYEQHYIYLYDDESQRYKYNQFKRELLEETNCLDELLYGLYRKIDEAETDMYHRYKYSEYYVEDPSIELLRQEYMKGKDKLNEYKEIIRKM